MSLVQQIVLTSVVTCIAVVFFIIALVADAERAAWVAFGLGIVAHALFLDARMRWREAHLYSEQNLRSIR
jgi:hypothetical protein